MQDLKMVKLLKYGSFWRRCVRLLLPKIKKQFDEGTSHKKDPRIGVSVGHKQIKKYGTRIR